MTENNHEYNQNNPLEEGTVLISWNVPEYHKYDKPLSWYIIAGTIGVILLGYALFTSNFLFSLFIVITGAVFVIMEGEDPPRITVTLTEEGLILGKKFYDYDEFQNFSLVYKPQQDIKNLYFEFPGMFHQRLSIPLEDTNPVKVREILSSYVEEDTNRTDTPLSEQLSRLLKI